MAMLPKLKIKALVSFPANVLGGTGISIDKANGNFTIDLNYSEFAFQGTLPAGSNVLVWDPVSNVYTLVPPSATGGISDAPTDGKVYGRQYAGWVDAWASPVLTGNPTAPTPSPGDNDTSVATTAFCCRGGCSAGHGDTDCRWRRSGWRLAKVCARGSRSSGRCCRIWRCCRSIQRC